MEADYSKYLFPIIIQVTFPDLLYYKYKECIEDVPAFTDIHIRLRGSKSVKKSYCAISCSMSMNTNTIIPDAPTIQTTLRGGSRGGLRVLEHPPKLPKVNYLLLLLINCQLTL